MYSKNICGQYVIAFVSHFAYHLTYLSLALSINQAIKFIYQEYHAFHKHTVNANFFNLCNTNTDKSRKYKIKTSTSFPFDTKNKNK